MTGTVTVELTVTGQWSVATLTQGWSDQEKERLAGRDEEALEALKDAAVRATLARPDDCETVQAEVTHDA